ncbi:ABC transporter substrate-binding protein [Blautia schinkii]|nr:ABC transporter substrate-binding protein [Blautia schinkii]
MNKKRAMALLLTGVLTAGMTGGTCLEVKAEDKPVELSFYMMNSPVNDQERIMEKANEIIEEKIGAHLNLIMVDGSSYAEKMNLMINSGDAWDLCFTASWGGLNFYENAQKGAYADLTELLPKLAPETYSRVPEGLWDGVTVDDKIYASVNYQQWGAASRSGFKFRKDLADETGFDWASLKGKPTLEILNATGDFIGKALEAHPEMIGWETSANYSLFANSPLHWDMEEVGDVATPGWIRYDDPGTVINQFDTEEFMEFCKIMRDWYDKGYVRKDGATVKDTSPDRKAAKFIAEQTTGWPDSIDFEGNADAEKMSMCTADIAPAVAVSNTRTVIKAGAGANAAVAVSSQSPNIEKAVELIELLNTDDELYMLITQGEEGTDYVYGEDGTSTLVDGKYNFNFNEWQLGQSYSPEFTRARYDNNESGEKQKESQSIVFAADKEADVSPLSGFVFDPSPVKTQIANCSSVITEMVPALSSGSIDPEKSVPEFIKRLEGAGVNDIIAEKQAQLDAWSAES